jgi:hypothetical protein
MAEERSKRLAVLIDADNASAKIVDGLFEEIAKLGEAVVRWIYGDFSSPQSKAWADVLTKHAITPKQQFAYTKGKNASDITLVIEAMDLLHSGVYEGFCLVSSDSDFTRLASRLREQGVVVYGFGEQAKTPESFRQACTRFIYTENLLPHSASEELSEQQPLDTLKKVEQAIFRILSEIETEEGWVYVGQIVTQLRSRAPDFDSRTYGHKTFIALVRAIPKLELRLDGSRWFVRVKPVAAPAKATKRKA